MVVKTELCAFSEYRIYPGHGQKFVRRDGQPVLLSTSKCKRLYILNKKKPAKLMWTQAWRRLNKKGKDEGTARKKTRRTIKVQRAIVGISLEDMKKKTQVSKPKVATDAATKEVKDRAKAEAKKKAAAANKSARAAAPKVTSKPTGKGR